MKGHMEDGKFHPHTPYVKGVRKSRDQTAKQEGVRIRKKTEPFKVQQTKGASEQKLVEMQKADIGRRAHDMGMSHHKMDEWENTVNSKVVKVKHEMINGRPVTTVRFENGEEWFEFDNSEHEEEFLLDNNFGEFGGEEGEFVKVDHPIVSGFVLMPSGKVLFGEKEDRRLKRDGENVSNEITFFEDPSHGFYKVPTSLLKELGINEEITKFSKRTPDHVFLEEDQDATTFFNALKENGLEAPNEEIKTKYFDSANENPASVDFRLCDECGETLSSVEALKRHKTKGHKK